jgi:methylenetetrahydrofolate reductase (NADPH)
MNFSDAYGPGKFALSFELFPPKTPQGEEAMFAQVDELVKLRPSFITCTYGAGGSTRDKTLAITARVRSLHGLPVASHLTCVGSTVDELRAYLADAIKRGVHNIVALRGDPPKGEKAFVPVAGGFRYANELVALIRSEFPQLGIAVAGYPEKHQEAPDETTDLVNLKRKVDAGADVILTQLFYRNEDFFRFRERCEAAGIRIPIVPGLLPVLSFAQIRRITSLCGASLPGDLVSALEAGGEDEQAQFEVGVEFATRQTQELLDAGVPGIHFYVLNRAEATRRVLGDVTLPAEFQR